MTTEDTGVAVVQPMGESGLMRGAVNPAEIVKQVTLVKQVMEDVMEEGVHYGKIPGCGDKDVLFKAGAEKLNLAFRLRAIIDPVADIKVDDLGNGHREYTILTHMLNWEGVEMATGLGSCSTMESKFRYRRVQNFEVVGDKIPDDYKNKKADYQKKGFGCKKVDNAWKWVKYTKADKEENIDIADVYNTCLKMAVKRSGVAGSIAATAASDLLTQDLEDMQKKAAAYDAAEADAAPPKAPPTPKPVAKKPAAKPPVAKPAPKPAPKAPETPAAPIEERPPIDVEGDYTQPSASGAPAVDLLSSDAAEGMVQALGSFGLTCRNIEVMFGAAVGSWTKKHREWMKKIYFKLEDAGKEGTAIDLESIKASRFEG